MLLAAVKVLMTSHVTQKNIQMQTDKIKDKVVVCCLSSLFKISLPSAIMEE